MLALLALWMTIQSPAPSSLPQAMLAAHVDVLAREYATSWCPPRALPVVARAQQQPDAYDLWVGYVAAHLRSGQPFGPDYPALAARARDLIYNVWFDCAKHEHDQAELDLRANQTPDVVGRALLAAFAHDSAPARAAAADFFTRAAYATP